MDELSDVVKQDLKNMVSAITALCDSYTETNFLKATRIEHDKDMRTCKVSTNSFNQTFQRVDVYSSEPGNWVVQTQPSGACGIVDLSRFESDAQKIGEGSFVFWSYIARKAITNPKGELFSGGKCSGLDQTEHLYDWRARDNLYMRCDYIEFSPI